MTLATAALLLFGYLLGSIPFGLLLTKFAGAGDIRCIGSGNIGATNVLRTGRKSLALLTLLLDGGKGAAAVLLAAQCAPGVEAWVGLAALLGHLFPVWLKFKGGKGVATSLGILLALAWPVGLAALALWILTAAAFHYSSLGALVALGLSPLAAYAFEYHDIISLTVVIAALVAYKHAHNIRRLWNHTEPKIGDKRDHATPPA